MSGIPSSMDSDMVRDRVRTKMAALGMSLRQYAEVNGYTAAYLSDFLKGACEPGKKILNAEGLKAVKYYEPKDQS